jgi:hypothetical protein
MNTLPLANDRLDAPSGIYAAFKTIGAAVAAVITWFLVATVLNLALRACWPHYHEAELAFNFTLAMKLARLVLGAISSLGAGFVAAWIGRGRIGAATLTGIVLLGLFIPGHYGIWSKFPVWYHLTFLVSLLPLTLLGVTLFRRIYRKAP